MSFRFTVVETSLNRAEFRWKWLKFLQYSFSLGAIVCLLLLVVAEAIICGWLTNKALAAALFGLIAVFGLIAWVVVTISVAAGTPGRNWLASALERVDGRLLDRLNTLLFLETHRGDARTESFALRIARQTQTLLQAKPSPSPFTASRPLLHFCGFVFLLSATVLLFHAYSPWKRLLAVENARIKRPVPREQPLNLALPATNSVEQNRIWGEVRITDPGADLKVTKLDVVPLQIEAAANQPLKKVAWFSAINGADEALHELPPPNEPRYAVYQPTVYLDELRLTDWDVVTYYAKANTENESAYGSEIYFMEVRPFREDILKIPGGEGGKAHRCLNELSRLISAQQHVIRQTYQHLQKPLEQENLRQQDRNKLSEAERDLADSAQHLYAKMAAEMENKPIGEALDSLAKAEQSLQRASQHLQANAMNDAQNRERSGLSELVAARKIFQKTVSDNPSAFNEANGDEEPAPPVADSSKKLNQMTEFRNEAKAAQDFVQKTLDQQKALERQTKSGRRNDFPRLGDQEKQLQQALEDFQQEHAKVFEGTQSESQKTQAAMTKAAKSLQQRASDARDATQQATQNLEQLNQAMERRSIQHQLADAYKLKQMLDQQIQTFGKCSNPGANVSDSDLQKTAEEARNTINQLKKIAEEEPTRDAFGQPLREALSGEKKVDLDARLSRVQQAQNDADKQQRAGEAKEGLSKVSQAFTASEPKSFQTAQQSDSLKPAEPDSWSQGMAELDSLIRQLEKGKISRQDQARQGHEALYNLQTGLRSQYGDNDRGNQILLQLTKMLKADTPLEVGDLKKLMDELQHFSVETSDRLAKKDDKPEVTNIDPTRLPPAYRGRIQKYFQKLSEKP